MKKYDEIYLEILRRMYAESCPPADIDLVIASGEGKIHGWFMNYYLSEDRQRQIIEEVLNENKIKNKRIRQGLTNAVWLGSSPTSTKTNKHENH
jgi:hypothetical protein